MICSLANMFENMSENIFADVLTNMFADKIIKGAGRLKHGKGRFKIGQSRLTKRRVDLKNERCI